MRTALILALLVILSAAGAMAGQRTVVSLDGTWQMAQGTMDAMPAAFDHTCPVPGLADEAKPAFEEVGVASKLRQAFWYRRTFTVPGPKRAVAMLKINKAQFGTKVWLNGEEAGEHLACFTPGYFDVSKLVRYGAENTLVVRVGAYRDAVPTWVPTNTDYEESKWIPGIYDSVALWLMDAPWIVSVQVAPRIAAGVAEVQVELRNPGTVAAKTKLAIAVREWKSGKPGQVAARMVEVPAGGQVVVTEKLRIVGPHLWTPEDPFLYVVRCETGGDATETRFGLREFRYDTKTGRAVLNGKPYFLRGTNFCMFRFAEDPIRGGLPWDHAWVRKLLTMPKSVMHWNSARVCIAPFPEFWYDLADETGWLLQDEFPIWGFHDEWSQEELERQFAEWVRERWNHPSIAIWDACNETLTPRTDALITKTRGLDLSGRPWDDGYFAPNRLGDATEIHPYQYLGQGVIWEPGDLGTVADKAVGLPKPSFVINEYDADWLQRNGDNTGGYVSYMNKSLGPNATPDQRRRLRAYDGAAETEYWRARRDAAGVMWFCYLTYSRPGAVTSDDFADLRDLALDPYFADYLSNAFSPLAVMIDDAPGKLVGGGEREYQVVVTNDLYDPKSGTVTMRITDENETRTVWEGKAPFSVDALGQSFVRVKVALPAAPGSYLLAAELQAKTGERVVSRRKFQTVGPEEARKLINLALNCPATASSEVTDVRGNCPAKFVNDGHAGTRWSSEFTDPQWISLDLGSEKTIRRVVLRWEAAYGKEYAIQVSSDGQTWTDAFVQKNGQGGNEELTFAPVKGRYVRMYGTKRANDQWGYSLWEFQVFVE
jgi:hypothetical protein